MKIKKQECSTFSIYILSFVLPVHYSLFLEQLKEISNSEKEIKFDLMNVHVVSVMIFLQKLQGSQTCFNQIFYDQKHNEISLF